MQVNIELWADIQIFADDSLDGEWAGIYCLHMRQSDHVNMVIQVFP